MRVGVLKRVVIVAALVATVGACGGGGGDEDAAKPNATDAAFCQKVLPLVWSGDQAGFDAATKTPPAGFDPKNDKSVVEWLEGHCYPGIAPDATPVNQRIATTAGAKLDGLTACLVVTSPPTNDTSARVAIYGRGDDPYDGEGIAIISGGEGHLGDGKPIPVEVRDAIGSAAPITVFKNIVLPRLGTVIAWSENGVSYGLYGRLYGEDRVPELVTLANKMQLVDGQLQLPAGVRLQAAGAGFPCSTSSPVTSASNKPSNPVSVSEIVACARIPDVASASLRPARRPNAMSS